MEVANNYVIVTSTAGGEQAKFDGVLFLNNSSTSNVKYYYKRSAWKTDKARFCASINLDEKTKMLLLQQVSKSYLK